MDLAHPSWLSDLLGRLLATYRPEIALSRLPAWARAGAIEDARHRSLRHIDEELRRSGLIYGSPKLPARVIQGVRLDRSEALFLGVISGQCFLALDVARIHGVPFDREVAEAELTMLLAAAAGREDLAASILERVIVPRRMEALDRLQLRVARALYERETLVTGNTVFDLPIHNGLVFGEARMVGHLAIGWYGRARFHVAASRRLRRAANRERGVLIQALLALCLERHPLHEDEQRVVRRQLRKLKLPRPLELDVLAALDQSISPATLASRIRSRPLRRFVIEQMHLATWLHGEEDDEAEDRPSFVGELQRRFGFTEDQIRAIEAQVADYFYDPTDVIDAFEVRTLGQRVSEKLVDRISREIEENLDRVVLEAKETGDLLQLLGRAARGHKLTPEERARSREQLIDLAKVVPSLAIIAAPGGTIIFAALLKVLPFSLLPSSFQRRDPPKRKRRPRLPPSARPASRR